MPLFFTNHHKKSLRKGGLFCDGADTGLTSLKLRRFVVARAMPSPAYSRLLLSPSRTASSAVREVYIRYHHKKSLRKGGLFYDGADTRTRTADPLITNQ